MKVLVLGGGVIGVSLAWHLAKAGHETIVVERQSGAGLETSFANAGEVSPGYSAPWAGPGVPVKAIRWLTMRFGPLVVRPGLDPAMYVWMVRMLRNCTAERYAVNKARMVRLAEYSRDVLDGLRRELDLAYDQRMQGTLQLFRTQAQLDHAADDIAVLKDTGVPYEVLDRAGCAGPEPALAAVADKFVGGLRLPHDETGDCHMFTQALAAKCAAAGVDFRYGATIDRIVAEGRRVLRVETSAGPLSADAYVVALGSYSPLLLKPIDVPIPVYPVKGYSITLPITDASGAPESTVMDESYKVAITRLGSRIRVGGTAELAGYDLSLHEGRRATLAHSVSDLFPSGGDLAKATFWCGLRPMTPDGTPIIGPTRHENLWLNTGHGTLGWTMACGSGRMLADLISGRRPEIESAEYSMARY